MTRRALPRFGFRTGTPAFAVAATTALFLSAVSVVPSSWIGMGAVSLSAQTLNGGAASLDRQNNQAKAHGFSFLETPEQVRRFVELGYLLPVRPNADFDVHNVSFPFARAEVRLFIQRIASQYRSACGEKLVVTSLTRPRSNQPSNASVRSVHPTGMAVDLRRSHSASCRQWLERTLLSLEGRGVLEAIYERNPPHYHVVVYPQPYAHHVAQLTGQSVQAVVAQAQGGRSESSGAAATRVASATPSPDASSAASAPSSGSGAVTHRVARGETLERIARNFGVTVTALRTENRLRTDRILAGQTLRIPGARNAVVASAEPLASDAVQHTVRRGESLWAIARKHGSSVQAIQSQNGIRDGMILPGQVLEVPVGR